MSNEPVVIEEELVVRALPPISWEEAVTIAAKGEDHEIRDLYAAYNYNCGGAEYDTELGLLEAILKSKGHWVMADAYIAEANTDLDNDDFHLTNRELAYICHLTPGLFEMGHDGKIHLGPAGAATVHAMNNIKEEGR